MLERLKAFLEEGHLAKNFELQNEEEEEWFKEYNLLTAKPVIYAANVAEDDLADDGATNEHVAKVRQFAADENSEVFVICAQIEQEIAELDDEEKKMFLEDLGIAESGLEKLIKASYKLLGLTVISRVERWKPKHGRLQKEPKLHRLQERYIRISSADLFVQKLSVMIIWWKIMVIMEPKKKGLSVPKEKSMSCRTATLYCSVLTYNEAGNPRRFLGVFWDL